MFSTSLVELIRKGESSSVLWSETRGYGEALDRICRVAALGSLCVVGVAYMYTEATKNNFSMYTLPPPGMSLDSSQQTCNTLTNTLEPCDSP